jgi:AGCS family alanine or glycine:cation symporter
VVTPYRLLFIAFLFLGAIGGLTTVWDISDTLNGLMAAPNLIALVLLAGVLVKEKVQYMKEEREAEARKQAEDGEGPSEGS